MAKLRDALLSGWWGGRDLFGRSRDLTCNDVAGQSVESRALSRTPVGRLLGSSHFFRATAGWILSSAYLCRLTASALTALLSLALSPGLGRSREGAVGRRAASEG